MSAIDVSWSWTSSCVASTGWSPGCAGLSDKCVDAVES